MRPVRGASTRRARHPSAGQLCVLTGGDCGGRKTHTCRHRRDDRGGRPVCRSREQRRSARRARHLTTTSGEAYKPVGKPIAVYGREAGQPIYFVYIRLNRVVPRNSNGSPAATVRLGGLGLSRPPTSSSMGCLTAPSSSGRYCYEQQLTLPQGPYPPMMGHPRPGLRLSVAVLIRGLAQPLTTTVTLRRRLGPTIGTKPYLRELHCSRPSTSKASAADRARSRARAPMSRPPSRASERASSHQTR